MASWTCSSKDLPKRPMVFDLLIFPGPHQSYRRPRKHVKAMAGRQRASFHFCLETMAW